MLGPKECVLIIPPFKLSENGIQNITSVCQIPQLLIAVSTRNGGEFSVKILNVGGEAKMISQKLVMIGVQLFKDCKVTWDTRVAGMKLINPELRNEKFVVKQITIEKMKEKYSKVFEERIDYGAYQYLQKSRCVTRKQSGK